MGNVKFSPVDPEAALQLGRILGRVDELWGRFNAVAALAPLEGSLAGVDDRLPQARFVNIHASQALSSALDHLMAWKLIDDGNRHPIQAHMTLLRGALEGSVRCRWLVDATVDSATRVGRGYAAKTDDYDERRKFEKALKGGSEARQESGATRGPTASERLAELREIQSVAGIPKVHFEDTTSLMKAYGYEPLFRLMSAAAHGKEWAFAAAKIEQLPEAVPPPGVAHGMISARDDVVVWSTRSTVRAIEQAVGDFESYVNPRAALADVSMEPSL